MSAAKHTPKRPSIDDLNVAAMWLDCNTGEEGEEEACKRVSAWLDHLAAERHFANACKSVGVPVKKARAALAKAQS